ncbi:MAG: sulfatase-like hydrolase/transferase [Candidatus Brocadiia bacterium]
MNIVFILTDTTNRHHLGCYGCKGAVTPNIDRLASEGMRFGCSYSSSPVCTPARGCIFTGVHAPVNGAWYNDATPYSNVRLMGGVFAEAGHRVGYSGKWHLDGGLYLGYGQAQGGFPQEWWYDGRNYTDDIGPDMHARWKGFGGLDFEEKLEQAFEPEDCWAHRVTDRCIRFLETAGDKPFLFVAAFDEPHAPFMAPSRYLEAIEPADFEIRPNVSESLANKPQHHQFLAAGHENTDADLRRFIRYYAACQSFVDHQVGRIVDAVDRLHGEDTVVVFTSDHGEQMGSHGCWGKGYMMYDESARTPLIFRGPGVARGVSECPVGQVDLLPTFCQLADVPMPAQVQGRSLRPALEDPAARVNDAVMMTYTRFGNSGEPRRYPGVDGTELMSKRAQEFFPIRAAMDGRHKLVVNLFDSDEFYDLQQDPYEMDNRIADPALAGPRDALHDWLLAEMVQTRDPMRCHGFAQRPWRAQQV